MFWKQKFVCFSRSMHSRKKSSMLTLKTLDSTLLSKAVMGLCSCCYFSDKSKTLEDAEQAMLELYCERSQLKDGHTVLDIGCGWGSLSLYIALKYSNCKVTGICNSTTQKAYIEKQCRYSTPTTNILIQYRLVSFPFKPGWLGEDVFIWHRDHLNPLVFTVFCRDRQLQNVEIIVADISTFEMEESYDRIFSIEMFEVSPSWTCAIGMLFVTEKRFIKS